MSKKILSSSYLAILLAALASIPLNPVKEMWLPLSLWSVLVLLTLYIGVSYALRWWKKTFEYTVLFEKSEALDQAQQIYRFCRGPRYSPW